MYSAERKFTIEEGCPWYEAQQTYGAPNVDWCEPSHCSIIDEPANTWSNIPFLLIGIALYKLYKKTSVFIFLFSLAIFFMGFFSLVYHATNNFLSQFFDFFGVYLAFGLPLSLNINRIFKVSYSYLVNYVVIVLATCMSFYLLFKNNLPVQHSVMAIGVLMVASEIICWLKSKRNYSMKYFIIASVILLIAQVFAQLDIKRVWCRPENVFLHGHAIWHVMAAFGMGALALHYKPIANPGGPKGTLHQ